MDAPITLVNGGEPAITLSSPDGPTITLEATEETFILDGGLAGPAGIGGDKHFEVDFQPADSVTVTHNLNKRPAVTVIDSAGTEVIGDVGYINNNQVVISFGSSFGGKVICN